MHRIYPLGDPKEAQAKRLIGDPPHISDMRNVLLYRNISPGGTETGPFWIPALPWSNRFRKVSIAPAVTCRLDAMTARYLMREHMYK